MSLDLDLVFSEFNFKVDKPGDHKVYEFEEFRLNTLHRMLYRENAEMSLAPKAVETLIALIERRGDILTKDELMSVIWTDSIVEESNLSLYLHLLRKTLGRRRDGKQFIETLRRRGYRFNGDVTVSENANRFSAQRHRDTEEIKNPFSDDERQAKKRTPRGLRVERHGNVLALADWKDSEKDLFPTPINTEQPVAAHYSDSGSRLNSRPLYVGGIALAALIVGTLSLIGFRYAATTSTSPKNGDVTFLNLTNGEDVRAATISPDGNYFVYASHDGERAHLWLQQTGQPNAVEVIPPFQGGVRGTTFSTDSKYIYLVATVGSDPLPNLYRVPTLGGSRSQILKNVGDAVSFSPDGREMVFRRYDLKANRSSVVVAPSDGSSERTLLTLTGDEFIHSPPAWAPDGKTIAYPRMKLTKRQGGCSVEGIAPETGEKTLLSPEEWDNCFRLAWTRDGQGLIFAGTKVGEAHSTRRDQLYYVSVADGVSRRVTTDSTSRLDYASLGVTDAGDILVVPFNRFSQIWAMDANGDSSSAVQLTTGFADGRSGIAPLNDGRVAYLTRHGDGFGIWLMNADGSGRKQLMTEPPNIEELRSASDGSFFVFAGRRDGWPHLLRVDANGGNLTQLTFGERQEIDSTVSPDGHWIVYNSRVYEGDYGKTALWKVSSSGGEPSLLSREECGTPHFSPDQRFVSCVKADTGDIAVISMEDGSVLNRFHAKSGAMLNVGSRWTPDGTALAYIAGPRNASNLWLQPIDGETARPLTDFKSGEIYNFAFSAKGDKLYLARGYSSRNATLIRNFR